MNLKIIGTKRLLKMYRNLRSDLYRPHDDDALPYDDEPDWDLFDAMKKELDTREHIPREKPVKKQKRILKYRRK